MTNVSKVGAGLLPGFALAAFPAAPSKADLVLTGAIIQINPPPSDVQGSDPTSSDHAFIWSERTGLTLSSNVSVDLTKPGTSDSSNGFRPSPGTVDAGTRVDTYLIHSDPVGSGTENYVASVTFDTPILGIIDTISRLAATDSKLGSSTTKYPGASTDRGLENTDVLDWVSNNGLTLNFTTSTYVDEARILVAAAVPEPSTWATGALGGAMVLGYGWYQSRRTRSTLKLA